MCLRVSASMLYTPYNYKTYLYKVFRCGTLIETAGTPETRRHISSRWRREGL
jgi:hypothetical protein